MSVDLSKIRPGDEVTILAIVKSIHGRSKNSNWGFTFGHTLSGAVEHYAHPSAIVSHTPRSMRVGDRVTRCSTGATRGEIKHVIDGHAWVGWSSGQQLIHQIADLEHADG